MSQPILTLTDINNNTLPVAQFGVIDAGAQSGAFPIRIWNNINNAAGISDAINPSLTTKTYNGLDSGDSVQNGVQVVQNQFIQVQCTSSGETQYTPIGGPAGHLISDSPPAAGNPTPPPTIHSGNYAQCLLRAVVPTSATSGNINFLLRLFFSYS